MYILAEGKDVFGIFLMGAAPFLAAMVILAKQCNKHSNS